MIGHANTLYIYNQDHNTKRQVKLTKEVNRKGNIETGEKYSYQYKVKYSKHKPFIPDYSRIHLKILCKTSLYGRI